MRLSRWFLLIGVMVAVGSLQVAQRHAVFFKGYAVGQRLQRVHERETELAWTQSRVLGLVSPSSLSRVTQAQKMKLVAWSTMPEPAVLSSAQDDAERAAVRVAAAASADAAAAGE